MKKLIFIALFIGSSMCYAAPAPLSPSLYYEMGGGVSFQRPLSEATIAPELTLSAGLDLPLSCDIWDIKDIAIANYPDLVIDYLQGQLDQLGQAVVAQLTSIGQGLAVAALQRALPGIYDLSQTLTSQISARVDIAKRSCEQVVNDINRGVNPLDAWKHVGAAVSWRTTLTGPTGEATGGTPELSDATSILDAQRTVAEEGALTPIPWFGVDLGGSSENPIEVVEDLVTAGMKLMLESTPDGRLDTDTLDEAVTADGVTAETNTINGTSDTPIRLGQLFEDTEIAVDWANRFIGEQEIYMCDDPGCESSFRPGAGLQVMLKEETDRLVELWQDLIDENDPDLDDLADVSSESVQVTVDLFDALMRFPEQDQAVYIGRLISDAALQLTVEKALAIRRMILVSSESPIVKGYNLVSEETDTLLQRIRTEIDDTMWTVETQQKLSSMASEKILNYDAIRTSNRIRDIRTEQYLPSDFVGEEPVGPQE